MIRFQVRYPACPRMIQTPTGKCPWGWASQIAVLALFAAASCTAQSYTGCNGQPASGLLALNIVSLNKSTGLVPVNGGDSRAPSTPFTWQWGDGSTTQGFFPDSHQYGNVRQNYTLQVISHENDGSTDCAELNIVFVGTPTSSPTTYTLTANEVGQGTVTSSPSGINCVSGGVACSASFNAGSTVTLTATAASGGSFQGWSSAASASCNAGNPCTVVMNSNLAPTATFVQNNPTFTPGTPCQVSESAASQDGKFYYMILTINPLAVIPLVSGYVTTITDFSCVITPPSGTTLYNMSPPVNPNETAWSNVALTVTENLAGLVIGAFPGASDALAIVQSLYSIVQALQAGSHPASVIAFTGSGLPGPTAQALQNIQYLVVYETPTAVQNLDLSISASAQWSYSLATPSGTVVNPTPPSGGSYGPIQTTITLP